jgi:diaminopimelate epimerase
MVLTARPGAGAASTLAVMRFVKAHGTGNDFVVLPDWDDRLDLPAALVRAVCDRRRGVGGDGVLRIVAGSDSTDVVMDYRNADGTVAEMCGNGVRVVAKHAVDHGLVEPDDDRVRIGTRAGVKDVAVGRDASGRVTAVTVDMGVPQLDPAAIPFKYAGPGVVDVPVDVDGSPVRLTAVSVGNPHAVVVVDDVDAAPVATLGPGLERHPRFPEGTNVEFVQVLDPGMVRARVWERGVGETAACGSGACAVHVALFALGRAGEETIQSWPGGTLAVHYDREDATVRLTGGAVEVASGELDDRWVDEVLSG